MCSRCGGILYAICVTCSCLHRLLKGQEVIFCMFGKLKKYITGIFITFPSPCYEHPGKPHLHRKKWDLQGTTLLFFILAQTHRTRVLVRTASPRQFHRASRHNVWSKNKENIIDYQLKNDIVGVIQGSIILHRYVILMFAETA